MGGLSPVLYRLLSARHAQKWSKLWRLSKPWRPPGFSLFSPEPQQSLTLLTGVLLKNRKNVGNHYCCPVPAIILTASELEAIREICRCSLKLSKKWGKGVGGGNLPGTSPPIQQVALGNARLVTPFSLSCRCLFLLLHLSPFRGKLDGG
jgi:hypothetical protein